jgi:importin subunit beta-1
MGVIGYVTFHLYFEDSELTQRSDLADAYPSGELADAFRQDWVSTLIKETKSNREFSPRTIETARWAREQVKRQIGGTQTTMAQS